MPKDTELVIISNTKEGGYIIEVFDIKTNLKLYEAQNQHKGNLIIMFFLGILCYLIIRGIID